MSPTHKYSCAAQLLYKYYNAPDYLVKYLQDKIVTTCFKKGIVIQAINVTPTNIYFIRKGLIRSYTIEFGKEITTAFYYNNQIAATFDAMLTITPTKEILQTIDDTWVEIIEINLIQQLVQLHVPALRITNSLMQIIIARNSFWAKILRISNAKIKYQFVQLHYPYYIQNIPAKYLASFLGIRQETLCRLKAKQYKG